MFCFLKVVAKASKWELWRPVVYALHAWVVISVPRQEGAQWGRRAGGRRAAGSLPMQRGETVHGRSVLREKGETVHSRSSLHAMQ